MKILGISCFYHDSAAVLIEDGRVIAAAQEERFTRKKHDSAFPRKAINYCLREADISVEDLDLVAFYEQPNLKLDRLIANAVAVWPAGLKNFRKILPSWIRQKGNVEAEMRKLLRYQGKIVYPSHHQSHAASAFFPSPFAKAAFLTLDGVGEWTTASYGIGENNTIKIFEDIKYPHSLGLLYSAFTYYTGFKVNSAEYKVMGLAPYGVPRYAELIYTHLIDVKPDGSFRLHLKYFDYHKGDLMINQAFCDLFGGPAREPESELTQREMDLAASVQKVTEEIVVKLCRHIRNATGINKLCLAGGVALNCVANGKILREKIFDDIWIQPAAGDAGGALGAALYAYYQASGDHRRSDEVHDQQHGSYLGPAFSEEYIAQLMKDQYIPHIRLSQDEAWTKGAELLKAGKIIGWFQGRMEFGPRALGNRSIIGDARLAQMQSDMNLKIKFRESFRPFAPAVLAEHVSEYFDIDRPSPYMLLTADVRPSHRKAMSQEDQKLWGIDKLNISRSDIPAVTHIDYSARVQTVDGVHNKEFYNLINAFYELTGCPVIINTSFNVRGEPIVCTPEDAYRCFMATDMDYLFLNNYLIDKSQQKASPDMKMSFELD